MKRRLYLLILFVAVTISSMAQNIGEAFYIYRNDGGFNAFFRDEVISMEYSYEDEKGNTYDEVVMQIINTADSIYKIPLAAIDSISFVQPEVIIKDNVLMMEKEMMDYLVSVDGMNLCFTTDMAEKYNFKKGDIIVYTNYDDERFEEGFVGKVSNVNISADSYQIFCDSIKDISEIFDQLIMVELLSESDDKNWSRRGPKEDDYQWWESNSIPLSWDLNVHTKNEVLNASLSGGVQGNILIKVSLNFTHDDHYFALTINHDWSYNAKFNVSAKGSFSSVNTMSIRPLSPIIRFPAILPIFRFQIGGTSFVRGEGGMDFDLSLNSPIHKYSTSISFDDWVFTGSHTNNSSISAASMPTIDASLSLDGFIQGGLMVQFDLGTIRCLGWVNASVDCYIGPKLEGNFALKTSSQQEGEINSYNLLKDSKLSLSPLTLDIEAYGQVHWLDEERLRHKFFSGSFPSPAYREWYLLPEFSNIQSKRTKSGYQFITNPCRDILLPVHLGFGIYDQDDIKITDYYKDEIYRLNNDWSTNSLTFLLSDDEGIKPGQKYTCYPMVRLFGIELRATPSIEFGEDLDIQTGAVKNIEATSADTYGHIVTEDLKYVSKYEYGICYTEKDGPDDWIFIPSEIDDYGNFYVLLSDLKPETIYIYCAYIKFAEDDYMYGEEITFKTGEMVFPVRTTDFKQTGSEYKKDGFENDGKKYSYKYDCAVTVELVDSKNVEDWGYVYEDPYGKKTNISLNPFGSPYTDTRYAYYRNEASSTVRLYEYVKFMGNSKYYYGEPKDYPVSHKEQGLTSCPDNNHPHWIDLGIGTLWQCCNVGASSPEDYGGYYTFDQAQAYNPPSQDQIEALLDNCTYTWTTQNGVNGGKFTGPNGGTIFLPAAGGMWSGEFYVVGSVGFWGYYWSSVPYDEGSGYHLSFRSGSTGWVKDYRYYDLSVRPVR